MSNTLANTTKALCEAAEALQKAAMAHEIATQHYNSIAEEFQDDIINIKGKFYSDIEFYKNKIASENISEIKLCNMSNEDLMLAMPKIITGAIENTNLIGKDFGYRPRGLTILSRFDFNYVMTMIIHNPEILNDAHIKLQKIVNDIKAEDEFITK